MINIQSASILPLRLFKEVSGLYRTMYQSPCQSQRMIGPRLLRCLQTRRSTSQASIQTPAAPPRTDPSRHIRLAYTLHKPPTPLHGAKSVDLTQNAIIVMHGLFGSKQNNRTMSKWVFSYRTDLSIWRNSEPVWGWRHR